jgi:hypothetical protein
MARPVALEFYFYGWREKLHPNRSGRNRPEALSTPARAALRCNRISTDAWGPG